MYRCIIALLLMAGCDLAEDPTALQPPAPEPEASAEPDPPACLDACYRGFAHLDCSDAEPELRCREDNPGACLWISTDCAVAGYAAPAEPVSQFVDAIYGYTPYWGRTAWRRETAMALDVQVGDVEAQPMTCACLDDGDAADIACLGSMNICDPEPAELNASPITVEGWRPESGMLTWAMGGTFTFTGFFLALEVDVPNRQARACLIGVSDTYADRPDPQCADRGTVTLSALPTDVDDIEQTQMHLRVEFDAVQFGNEDEPRFRDVAIEFAPEVSTPTLVPVF